MTWAQRIKRVFHIDVTTCVRCGGALRIVACIDEPKAIRAIPAHFAEHGTLETAHYRPGPRAPPAAVARLPAVRTPAAKPANGHSAATTPQACARAADGIGHEKAGESRKKAGRGGPAGYEIRPQPCDPRQTWRLRDHRPPGRLAGHGGARRLTCDTCDAGHRPILDR